MEKEAMFYEKLEEDKVRCGLCSHRCIIAVSEFGVCGVRQNRQGVLYTLVYAEAIAAHVDPIEKKPLYHFLPGTSAFSLATLGCNFQCGFCQNWQISQISKKEPLRRGSSLKPEAVIQEAKERRCASISYTYTEPTIFFEYAYDIARLAKDAGLYNSFVTNGYMTREAIDTIRPYLDAANIDLKSFRDEFYTYICRGSLEPVLDSIRYMKELGIWIEITTLVIPDENDSDLELHDIANFIASIGVDIPWHISRFHPDYKFSASEPTPLDAMKQAYDFGKEAGLRYVYLGNVAEEPETLCAHCGKCVLRRRHYDLVENNVHQGACAFCGKAIDGIFL